MHFALLLWTLRPAFLMLASSLVLSGGNERWHFHVIPGKPTQIVHPKLAVAICRSHLALRGGSSFAVTPPVVVGSKLMAALMSIAPEEEAGNETESGRGTLDHDASPLAMNTLAWRTIKLPERKEGDPHFLTPAALLFRRSLQGEDEDGEEEESEEEDTIEERIRMMAGEALKEGEEGTEPAGEQGGEPVRDDVESFTFDQDVEPLVPPEQEKEEQEPKVSTQMVCPSGVLGLVIGSQGRTIKKLTEDARLLGARIWIHRIKSSKDTKGKSSASNASKNMAISIVGPARVVDKFKTRISVLISSKTTDVADDPHETMDMLLRQVPQNMTSSIVQKGVQGVMQRIKTVIRKLAPPTNPSKHNDNATASAQVAVPLNAYQAVEAKPDTPAEARMTDPDAGSIAHESIRLRQLLDACMQDYRALGQRFADMLSQFDVLSRKISESDDRMAPRASVMRHRDTCHNATKSCGSCRVEVLTGPSSILVREEPFASSLLIQDCDALPHMADLLRVHHPSHVDRIRSCVQAETPLGVSEAMCSVRAAGATCAAVDRVVTSGVKRVVVPTCTGGVRNGYDSGSGVNPACVAAEYARCVHRAKIRRVAIVSVGANYANGSANCLAKATQGQCWPGVAKDEEVLFLSVHVNGYDNETSDASVKMPADSGSIEFRETFMRSVAPRLDSFMPDLILSCMSFDMHVQDVEGNDGLVSLTEGDFSWMTRQLVKAADRHAQGRLVSVLEDGRLGVQSSDRQAAEASELTGAPPVYGVVPLCTAAHVAALMGSEFAGGI